MVKYLSQMQSLFENPVSIIQHAACDYANLQEARWVVSVCNFHLNGKLTVQAHHKGYTEEMVRFPTEIDFYYKLYYDSLNQLTIANILTCLDRMDTAEQ